MLNENGLRMFPLRMGKKQGTATSTTARFPLSGLYARVAEIGISPPSMISGTTSLRRRIVTRNALAGDIVGYHLKPAQSARKADGYTRQELYEKAKRQNVEGRSKMTKRQ